MVKVYFETPSYCEQVASFANEKTYIKCLPALEELKAEQNFELVTEACDEHVLGSLTEESDEDLFAELERRGYAVKSLWRREDVQCNYNVSDEEAVEIVNEAICNEWIKEQINEMIENVADGRGHECKE
jgi:phage gp29-like protein